MSRPKKNEPEKTSVTLESPSKIGKPSVHENKKSSPRKRSDQKYELKRTRGPLARIGVTVEQYVAAPKISPILREIQGGKSKALKAMRFSSSDLIQQFLAKYDSISARDRERLSIEAIALSAGINIPHLWGEIMLAMREHSVNSVKIIAVANHPEVLKKTLEFATLPGGIRDREHIHTMLGALPSNKGATFFVKNFYPGGKPKGEDESEDDRPPEIVDDLEYIFPGAELIQERVQPIRQKLLETGK